MGPTVLGFPEIGTLALELFNPPLKYTLPRRVGVGFGMRGCGEMISGEFQSLQNGPTKVYSTSRILRWMVVLCGLFDGHRCSLPPFFGVGRWKATAFEIG